MRRDVLLAIVGMALVTYLTRAGGVWAGRGPLRAWVTEGPLARRLAHLPGAVLVAIVVPMVARGGIADLGATLVSITVATRTRSPMATIAAMLVLLAALWRGRSTDAGPWVTAGVVALVASTLLPGQWYIVLGALAGCAVGTTGDAPRPALDTGGHDAP